jgi:O-antigen/teichoic acid export membrane protein
VAKTAVSRDVVTRGGVHGVQLRFRHIVRNVFSNWVSTAANMAVGFFLSPYIVHHLGNVAYGVWVLAMSSVNYLGMLDLGMRSSVLRFVSRARTQGNHEEASDAVSAALWVRLQVSVLVLLLSLALALLFPVLFLKGTPEMARPAQIAVMIVGANLAFAMSLGVFGGVISGLNRYDLQTAVSLGQLVIRVTGVLLVLRSGHGIVAIAVCEFVAALLANISLVVIAKRLYPELHVRFKRPERAMLRSLWSYSVYAFLTTVAIQLVYQTDNLVVGGFVSAAAVAFYAIGASLVRYTDQFTGAMTMSFVPAASTFDAAGDATRLRTLYTAGTRAMLALSLPILTTLLIRGRTFLGLWMGEQYRQRSGTVLILLASTMVFSQANSAAFAIAFGTDRHKVTAKWAIGEGISNLILSVLLVRPFGIYGVALGTVIPNLFVHLVLWPPFIGKMIGLRSWAVFGRIWSPMFLSAVPFALASYVLDVHLHTGSITMFFAQTLALLPVFLAAIAVVFRHELRSQGIPAIRSFFQEKVARFA